jgi:hypothetical protein
VFRTNAEEIILWGAPINQLVTMWAVMKAPKITCVGSKMKNLGSGLIDLTTTIPTGLSSQLRAAAEHAVQRAIDPFNALDNNPFIGRAWIAVSIELRRFAESLDQRLAHLLSDPVLDRHMSSIQVSL